MDNNKLLAITLVLTLGTGSLTACENNDYNSEDEKDKIINVLEEVKGGEKRVFAPYEHLFFIRYSTEKTRASNINGYSVEIPDSYEVVAIEQFYEPLYSSTQTGGYDVWYTNTETVEVESVFNESVGRYDFSRFGKTIEKDNYHENQPKVNIKSTRKF